MVFGHLEIWILPIQRKNKADQNLCRIRDECKFSLVPSATQILSTLSSRPLEIILSWPSGASECVQRPPYLEASNSVSRLERNNLFFRTLIRNLFINAVLSSPIIFGGFKTQYSTNQTPLYYPISKCRFMVIHNNKPGMDISYLTQNYQEA